jgi:hypothetical protein
MTKPDHPTWYVFPCSDEPERLTYYLRPRWPYRAFASYGEAVAFVVLRWAERWDAQDPDPTTETYP